MLGVKECFLIHDLYQNCVSISEVTRLTDHNRKIVRGVLTQPLIPLTRLRKPPSRKFDPYVPYLTHRISGGAELRLRAPDGALGHAQRFLPAVAYTAVPAAGLRMVRKADGTGVFLCLENAAITLGDYRLELTFRRDNQAQDPGSEVLRQAGDTGPERVTLDLPWATVAPRASPETRHRLRTRKGS